MSGKQEFDCLLYREERLLVALLMIAVFTQSTLPARACGPETIDPIFVFTSSPDLPFDDFAKGKIGILQSTFGRKTLVIAHRYLGGGTFTADEQIGLVEALKGKAPEDDAESAIKEWIKARKEVVGNDKEAPAIYDERRHEGYDFFPNCTRNAFEVATQTLKERAASYGTDDTNFRDWLSAQDIVFRNCAEGAEAPPPVDAAGPSWLQKDRAYQIAAASFYSLNFKEARSRFEKIAEDYDSPWQETAGYLVGRTLVREASLSANKKEQHILYEQAEASLLNVIARGGKFQNAAKRLLGLVRYRLHPEERVRELAQVLDEQTGNENIRQDLIDYTWLLDKFDEQVQKAEEERRKQLNPTSTPTPYHPDPEYQARYDAIQRGELIELYFSPKNAAGEADYSNSMTMYLKPDVRESDVLGQVEIKLGRKLSTTEGEDLKERYAFAMSRRQWLLSPNRKWDTGNAYEGCESHCNELTLDLVPRFLRADELTDWILTFQSHDPRAYTHAFTRWRDTRSTAWLAVALTKVRKSARSLPRLMREAEQINPDSAVYPTIAYQLIRLRLELNKTAEAKKLLDQIISTQFESLPVSSQNLFLEQRLGLADSVADFLKFAARKPAAFHEFGTTGRISDLLKIQKSFWDPEYYKETRDEYERKVDEDFKEFLPWDERKAFDDKAADIFNWHFSLAQLLEAARDPALPDYLQRPLALSVWTRAVLLKNDAVARDIATDVRRLVPEMSPLLDDYLSANTTAQRNNEALYIMLKFSNLSPWVPTGVPEFATAESAEYYFETSWWCKPIDTEYRSDGTEVPKIVANPRFLTARVLADARRERATLAAIGDAKSFLGKRVIEWARNAPNDPRMPEAIYIAVQANQSYKYGCDSWESDEETMAKLEKLLREKYPSSTWTAKLNEGGP